MNKEQKNEKIPQEPQAPMRENRAELSDEAMSSVAGGERWWEWGDARSATQTNTPGSTTNAEDTRHHYPGI